MLKKQVAELQKQLAELKKDQSAALLNESLNSKLV